MATNPFQASGTNDVPALRRAITAAFVELVRQINRERNTDNTAAAARSLAISTIEGQLPGLALQATRGDAFPETPVFAQEFHLDNDIVSVDNTDPDNPITTVLFAAGWYKYSDQWDSI